MRHFRSSLVFAVGSLVGGPAFAQPSPPPAQCDVDVPGPVVAVLCAEGKAYVARGAQGVSVYDISDPKSPKLVREIATGPGKAVGFHTGEGQIWIVLESRTAVPIGEGKAEAVPSPARSVEPATAAAPARIAVRRVTPGTVELGTGTSDGVRIGDRFAIYRAKTEEGGAGFTGEEMVTVVEVTAVRQDFALGQLPRGARVVSTDYARRAQPEQTVGNAFPPRMPDVGEVSVVLRPIINTGTPLGFGVLADLDATYWGNIWFAGVSVQPLGIGATDDGSIVSTAALVEGGYDAPAFAAGLGAGISWVNGDADHMLRGSDFEMDSVAGSGPTVTEQKEETHAAFTLSQRARLGARDGVNFAIRNLLILGKNELDKSGFIYGGTTARFAIPLAMRSDLLLEGGGGVMGYWFSSIGVATWLVGSGAPGSWRISVAAGGAGVWGSKKVTTTSTNPYTGTPYTFTTHESIDIIGPMVSIGLAHRFAF